MSCSNNKNKRLFLRCAKFNIKILLILLQFTRTVKVNQNLQKIVIRMLINKEMELIKPKETTLNLEILTDQ